MSWGMRDWESRHYAAMMNPTDQESMVLSLIQTATTIAETYPDDRIMREAAKYALFAARVLLDGDLGRLDGGTLDSAIRDLADVINLDLDTEEWMN